MATILRLIALALSISMSGCSAGAGSRPPPARAPARSASVHARAGAALSHALVAASLCAALASPASARLLTDEEVASKLASVPVFAVTQKSGKPFLYDLADGAQEGRFFLEYESAEEQVRKIPSRLLKPVDAAIRSISLDQAYFNFVVGRAAPTGAANAKPRTFRLVPSASAVTDATRQVGHDPEAPARLPKLNALNGAVPLFVEPSLQVKSADGADRTPVFFGEADLLATFDRASAGTGAKPQIRVTDLQTLIARMQTDESLDSENLVLVPSSSALAVAEASARAQAEERAQLEAANRPLSAARTLSDEQVMSLPFASSKK